MALTRNFKETVRARAQRDEEFRLALMFEREVPNWGRMIANPPRECSGCSSKYIPSRTSDPVYCGICAPLKAKPNEQT